jgi:UTP--glucose-1-phosphate uridylyltransferase
MEIVKAIIPAAGFGTRFLPYTKAIPREMLPLLNKPAIQHIAEEALFSGLTNILIITNKSKKIIADHFDSIDPLELGIKDKVSLTTIERLIRQAQYTYIRQSEPLGLGHAIWLTRHLINKEYFAVGLPDDIIINKQQPAFAQLIRIARQEKASVIAVQEVPAEKVSSYGIVAIKRQITPSLFQLSSVIEKPLAKDAPSNLAIVGRYILSPKIFSALEWISVHEGTGELQLTDAIAHMMQHNERVFAYKVQGTRYDLGTPLGWIKSVIQSSLETAEYGPAIRTFLASLEEQNPSAFTTHKTTENTTF